MFMEQYGSEVYSYQIWIFVAMIYRVKSPV